VLARGGVFDDAERLAREAVELGRETDMLNWHARALVDLGEVYVLASRADEARPRFEEALAIYERKGNLVMAAKTHSALTELTESEQIVTERTI
jgi:hypothetical protein